MAELLKSDSNNFLDDLEKFGKVFRYYQNKYNYQKFEESIISENRFFYDNDVRVILDTLRENFNQCTNFINSESILYRARIIDDSYKINFAKNFFDKLNGEFGNDMIKQILYFDNIDTIINIIKSFDTFEVAQALEEFLNEYKENRFKGYSIEESLSPPKHLSKEGRLNPKGISYLYTSTDINTCLLESKAFIGQDVSVAKIVVKQKRKIFDFTKVSEYDLETIGTFNIRFQNLLQLIASKFSEPTFGNDELYLPTQFIAEFFKSEGFDGVKFRSAININGSNIVLFSDKECDVIDTNIVKIKSSEIVFEEVDFADITK